MSHLENLARSVAHEAVKAARSGAWRRVEREHLAAHPTCAACGTRRVLQVHHVSPFHVHPELELDPTNLISLCMTAREDHLRIGHGGNFRAANLGVRRDAAAVLADSHQRTAVELRARLHRQEDRGLEEAVPALRLAWYVARYLATRPGALLELAAAWLGAIPAERKPQR